MADHEQISVEDHGRVRVITLNRPEKLNAWTRVMQAEINEVVHDGNDDPSIGAFVFTGAGRAMCAGADIGAEFSTPSPESDNSENWVDLARASKPMVTAVNGVAVGVGLTLWLPTDFIIAAESARLSCRFVKMGLVPELASSHFLVQRCGWGQASDLSLSGRMVSASEAKEVGLVDSVVLDDELMEAALARANSYAENPAPQLRMIKELLTVNGTDADHRAVQGREMKALNEAFRTPEHREAVAAFMEKRAPNFSQA
ncbi:MAG: enoyl-CoA hydratase/carnithine racemase [Candidatus Poriferisodalaceae bacterium]|jgi:enoyl-CoA hydratase/carnithine racemase